MTSETEQTQEKSNFPESWQNARILGDIEANYLSIEDQKDFLLLSKDEHLDSFSDTAKLINPEICLKALREPEPYLTKMHYRALVVLRQHDWSAVEIKEAGNCYFEYKKKDSPNWCRIPKAAPRYKSAVVREICDNLFSGQTVYVKYENENNSEEDSCGCPLHIYTRNVLRLQPIVGYRKFKRSWRNSANNCWFSLGATDHNCDVEAISSETHTGVFFNENEGIIYMTQWLLRARERDEEQKRLEKILSERYEKV